MTAETAALSLYGQIASAGYNWIEDAVRNHQPEFLHLDFKLKRDPQVPGAQPDDQRTYSKALSGFANAEGGVIVWGVDARKPANDRTAPDAAESEAPITHLSRFRTDLEGLTGQMVSPLVPGILMQEVKPNRPEDCGFLVVLIPEGTNPPYMAQKDHRYYARTGSSFFPLENYQVRDLMGRRAKPKLQFVVSVDSWMRMGEAWQYQFVIALRNEGRAMAMWPALKLWVEGVSVSSYELDGNGNPGIPRAPREADGSILYAGSADHVIFPGQTRGVTRTEYIPLPVNDWESAVKPFSFRFQLLAKDMEIIDSEESVTREKVVEGLRALRRERHPVEVYAGPTG